MPFPHPTALEHLRRAWNQDRLGHAYLITGPRGGHQEKLALELATLVNRDTLPPAGILAHPDVHLIAPESKSRRITVEQTRTLEDALHLRATSGKRKIGIILHADGLTPQASNAFLKTLEEPPASSLLLLVTHDPGALLDTILSRCLHIALAPGGDTQPGPHIAALLRLLENHADHHAKAPGGIPAAYRALRDFTALLATLKADIQKHHDDLLSEETARYAQTTDGAWLSRREDHYKGLTEVRYLDQRILLIEALQQWWADILRQKQAPGAPLAHPAHHQATARLATKLTFPEITTRLEALATLPDHLARNIQETLALEAALLKTFA